MIKQSTVMCVLDKRAAGSDVWDSIKGWWKGLSEEDRRNIKYTGIGAIGGLGLGAGIGGWRGALAGATIGAGAGYAGSRWLHPYLANLTSGAKKGDSAATQVPTPAPSVDQEQIDANRRGDTSGLPGDGSTVPGYTAEGYGNGNGNDSPDVLPDDQIVQEARREEAQDVVMQHNLMNTPLADAVYNKNSIQRQLADLEYKSQVAAEGKQRAAMIQLAERYAQDPTSVNADLLSGKLSINDFRNAVSYYEGNKSRFDASAAATAAYISKADAIKARKQEEARAQQREATFQNTRNTFIQTRLPQVYSDLAARLPKGRMLNDSQIKNLQEMARNIVEAEAKTKFGR